MRKIITMLQPFAKNQNVVVYENGNKIALREVSIEDLPNEVSQLVIEYNVKQIDFIGAKQYAKGLGTKIQENELLKSNNQEDLIINYL